MHTLRFLFRNLGRFSSMFWILFLVGGLDGAAGFAVPILLSEFTKGDLNKGDLIQKAIPLLTICIISSLILQWCLRRWAEALQPWFSNALRAKLFRDVEGLSVERLCAHHSGYIASLINQVASSVGSIASTILWLVGHLIVTLVLFFLFTARESVQLAYANLFLLALFVSVSVILARRMVPRADLVSRTSALAAERFIDFLSNVTTVKKLGVVNWAEARMREEFVANNSAVAALQIFHANRWALLHSIFFSSLLLTICVLVSRITVGAVSPSILILFIAGFSTIRGFAERLSELIKSLLETDASVIRLTSITADGGALGTLPVPKLSEILMRDLSFTHTNSHHQIRIPYFALRPGDRILITGRSGQGKSTFLSILARQLFPAHGESLWNGVGYQHYDTSLAEVFAYAGQEAELFNLSLRDNLRMGRDYSDQDLREILCDLGLEGFLKSLPEGLDSKLGERALKLSAGQKQRINIARAILLNRPVLLLDEPTSHLDQDSERCVIERLGKLSPEAAIVVVSHQPIFREWCQKELTFETGVLKWT